MTQIHRFEIFKIIHLCFLKLLLMFLIEEKLVFCFLDNIYSELRFILHHFDEPDLKYLRQAFHERAKVSTNEKRNTLLMSQIINMRIEQVLYWKPKSFALDLLECSKHAKWFPEVRDLEIRVINANL